MSDESSSKPSASDCAEVGRELGLALRYGRIKVNEPLDMSKLVLMSERGNGVTLYRGYDEIVGLVVYKVGRGSTGMLMVSREIAQSLAAQGCPTPNPSEYDNVLEMLDCGVHWPEVYCYIKMSLCPMGDVDYYLTDSFAPIPNAGILKWAKELTRGVLQLHQNDVAHRDIKPQNLFLLAPGAVKIGDSGCARRLTEDTRSETMAGTVGYVFKTIVDPLRKLKGKRTQLYYVDPLTDWYTRTMCDLTGAGRSTADMMGYLTVNFKEKSDSILLAGKKHVDFMWNSPAEKEYLRLHHPKKFELMVIIFTLMDYDLEFARAFAASPLSELDSRTFELWWQSEKWARGFVTLDALVMEHPGLTDIATSLAALRLIHFKKEAELVAYVVLGQMPDSGPKFSAPEQAVFDQAARVVATSMQDKLQDQDFRGFLERASHKLIVAFILHNNFPAVHGVRTVQFYFERVEGRHSPLPQAEFLRLLPITTVTGLPHNCGRFLAKAKEVMEGYEAAKAKKSAAQAKNREKKRVFIENFENQKV